jgi:tetrahydromethanopterin S-methyltransferase subunit B
LSVTLLFTHKLEGDAEALPKGVFITSTPILPVPVQPVLSVTVTEYAVEVGGVTVGLEIVALLILLFGVQA